MHEFSLTTALIEQVGRHVPPGARLRRLVMEAGPLQGIDPDAMQWAWQSATAGGPYEGSTLELKQLPWKMRCEACGTEWESPEMTPNCRCGVNEAHPVGGNDLLLRSLVCDEAVSGEDVAHASSSR